MKIFRKEKTGNGRRNIYFCGIKIFSYKKHKQHTEIPLRYISEDCLPILLKDKFYEYTGKLPTETLETLNEKIIWASMFDVTPLKIQCADKYTVREYIKKTIGEKYLIKMHDYADTLEEININKLPDKFVLKFSEGSGKVFLVPNKKTLDINHMKSVIRKWSLDYFWTHQMEMQYKNSARKIIIEEFVDTKIEYKLWIFNKKCEFIKIEIMNDFAENGKPNDQYGKYFYPDWKPAEFRTIGKEPEYDIPKPKHLSEMIKIAEKLAKPFDFVRVDFYETKSGELKFGELTFSPAAGHIHFTPESKNLDFGKLFILPNRDKNGFPLRKKVSK